MPPDSATGSNGSVTISLTGSGNTVTQGMTTAFMTPADGTICDPVAYFLAKQPTLATFYIVDTVTDYQCESGYVYWYAYFEDGGSSSWQNGVRLGNSWMPNPPFSGFPTELVES